MNSFKETAPVAAEGFGLAAIAGYVNVVVLGFFAFNTAGHASALSNVKVPVSHMTGAFSRLGIDMALGNRADLIPVGSIVAGFFLGALITGATIGGLRLHHARRYGLILIAEGFVLLAAGALWNMGDWPALTLAALACGLQNAMTGFYRGMMLRTTHVTGLVTDIATEVGILLRGHRIRAWRMALQASILGGYFLGGWGGAAAFLLMEKLRAGSAFVLNIPYVFKSGSFVVRLDAPALTLLIPALACLVAGLSYIRWLNRRFGSYADLGDPLSENYVMPSAPVSAKGKGDDGLAHPVIAAGEHTRRMLGALRSLTKGKPRKGGGDTPSRRE